MAWGRTGRKYRQVHVERRLQIADANTRRWSSDARIVDTSVLVSPADGPSSTITADGPAGSPLQARADGVAAQTVYTGSGTPADPYRSTVVVLRSDGESAAVPTVDGFPVTPLAAGADGYFYQAVRTGSGTAADPFVVILLTVAAGEPTATFV